jgi:hypothetical protein
MSNVGRKDNMKILTLVFLLISTSICFSQTKDELIEKLMVVADAKGSYEASVELIKQRSTDLVVRGIILKHYTWEWYREEYRKGLNEWSRDELVTIIKLFEDNSEALALLDKLSESKRIEYDFRQTDAWKNIESDIINLPKTSEADKWLNSSDEKKAAYLNGVMNATELTFHNYMKYSEFEYSQITNHPAINQLCRDSTQYPDVSMLIDGLDIFYTKEDKREETKNIPAITATMIVRDALYGWDIEKRMNEAIALSQKQNSSTNSVEE